jgi:hypothetical protein
MCLLNSLNGEQRFQSYYFVSANEYNIIKLKFQIISNSKNLEANILNIDV